MFSFYYIVGLIRSILLFNIEYNNQDLFFNIVAEEYFIKVGEFS